MKCELNVDLIWLKCRQAFKILEMQSLSASKLVPFVQTLLYALVDNQLILATQSPNSNIYQVPLKHFVLLLSVYFFWAHS